MKHRELIALTLILALFAGSSPASAQQTSGVVGRAEVDQAVAEKVRHDESDRDTIRTLLGRDDVKAMAEGMGLDVRRATAAVSTLEGEDLQRVSARAAVANDVLAGGDTTIRLSLIAILLIIIIVILLVK